MESSIFHACVSFFRCTREYAITFHIMCVMSKQIRRYSVCVYLIVNDISVDVSYIYNRLNETISQLSRGES